jgi:ABC-type transport system involved in multi-copper enzyme maturation permease subunit
MLILSSFLPGPGSWGLSTVAALPLFVLRIAIGLQACRFFVEARRTGSMELLLCTPLSVKDILHGQWLALKRRYLVPIIVVSGTPLLSVILTFVSQPDSGSLPWWAAGGFTLGSATTFLTDVFAIAWVGMLVGLTAKKPSLASGLTLFYAVVLPWFVFCVPRILIDVPLIFWARDKLHRELRALISQRYLAPVLPVYAPANPGAKPPPLLRG